MKQAILFWVLFSIFSTVLPAQEASHVPQQFLVKTKKGTVIKELLNKIERYNSAIKWELPKQIIPNMSLWELTYQGHINEQKVLEFIQSLSSVETVQYNHYVELRDGFPAATTPNDPLFRNQWQHINIGAGGGIAGVDLDTDLAWDITTGGLTAQNDTIVVAVIDNGISQTHVDLLPNIWYNRGEIPNNGIDDDQNGYVDDYQGWNPVAQNDYILGGNHGTSVSGIIGAKGNNGTGVTGINWDVKIMMIKTDFNVTESVVLAAYGYALNQRKLYNQTNGQEGAYVVVTNASWGMDNGHAADAPLWCAFYDTLGRHGILSVGATANRNVDVDQVGDLPTTCTSDYLISVTNINKQGHKAIAAYGATHIDLGAFGDGVYTTQSPANTYGLFGGTSGATPQVSGAIALLYAGACRNFIDYARIYPDSAALRMKSYIMGGVTANVDLVGKTVSEGHLNINNSMNLCVNACPATACFAPYGLQATNITDVSAAIEWTATSRVNQLQLRYRTVGGTWSATSMIVSNQSLILTALSPCTDYEIELRAVCSGTNGDSSVVFFKTDGCCQSPVNLQTMDLSNDSALIAWQAVLAAQAYRVAYKEKSNANWSFVTISDTSIWLQNLRTCTYYDAIVSTICVNGDTTISTDTLGFFTRGCASCASVSYCADEGQNTTDDWIQRFSIDEFSYTSGNNNGYLLYDTRPILLGKGDYHNITITQGKNYLEYVTVWLDINQDGDFLDAGETLYNGSFTTLDTVNRGSIIVPATALLGVTRLRVALRWNRLPLMCGSFDYGEVEDYCVQVVQGNSVAYLPSDIEAVKLYPNPFVSTINIELELKQSSEVALSLYNTTGQLIWANESRNLEAGLHWLAVPADLPKGIYLMKIKTNNGLLVKRVVSAK